MTVAAARPPWYCPPQAVRCENGHTLWWNKAGYRVDLRDITGHSLMACKDCSTFFLAVFVSEPSPFVLCFAMAKESYDEWNARPGRMPPTLELLYLIRDPNGRSHYPTYAAR